MIRSLAALTLALLVGFGSTAHSNSSKITDTYPVDCPDLLFKIYAVELHIRGDETTLLADKLLIDQVKESELYTRLAELSIIYNTFCK